MYPFVSVIIVGKNVEHTLHDCLESVTKLDYPTYETIYVDDGSQDRSCKIAEQFPMIRRMFSNGQGPSIARNLGIRQARGELIAFTDADCIVDRQWLLLLVQQLLQYPDAAAIGGRQLPTPNACLFERELYSFMEFISSFIDYVRISECKTAIPVAHNPSCNVLYRRKTLLDIGGFRNHLWPGEDVDLDYRLSRAGHQLLYYKDAIVYHAKPQNIYGWIVMMYRYGWAQGVLCRIHGFFRRLHFAAFSAPWLLLLSIKWVHQKALAIVFVLSFALLSSIRLRIAITGSIAWLTGFLIGFCIPPAWTKQQLKFNHRFTSLV